jgi:hypothetical protein
MVLFDGALFVRALRIGIRHAKEVQCLQRSEGGIEEGERNIRETENLSQGASHGLKLRGRHRCLSRVNKGRAPMVRKMVGTEPASMVEIMLRDSILYYFVYVRSFYAVPFLPLSSPRHKRWPGYRLISINVVNALAWVMLKVCLPCPNPAGRLIGAPIKHWHVTTW